MVALDRFYCIITLLLYIYILYISMSEHNCTEQVPNGHVYTPCRSGYSCRFTCDTGFFLHPLVRRSLVCENGEWVTEATKYDRTITPETACVREGKTGEYNQEMLKSQITDQLLSQKIRHLKQT